MASDSVDNVKDTFDRALNWGKQTLNEVVSILPPPQAYLIFFLTQRARLGVNKRARAGAGS